MTANMSSVMEPMITGWPRTKAMPSRIESRETLRRSCAGTGGTWTRASRRMETPRQVSVTAYAAGMPKAPVMTPISTGPLTLATLRALASTTVAEAKISRGTRLGRIEVPAGFSKEVAIASAKAAPSTTTRSSSSPAAPAARASTSAPSSDTDWVARTIFLRSWASAKAPA
jgi:hypothetical protein